jgi:catechol 2,3-dioxygenase-like lactoylglutathione lyase family enzyme
MESAMVEARKARAVGLNHVALEVGDIEDALAFYVASGQKSYFGLH